MEYDGIITEVGDNEGNVIVVTSISSTDQYITVYFDGTEVDDRGYGELDDGHVTFNANKRIDYSVSYWTREYYDEYSYDIEGVDKDGDYTLRNVTGDPISILLDELIRSVEKAGSSAEYVMITQDQQNQFIEAFKRVYSNAEDVDVIRSVLNDDELVLSIGDKLDEIGKKIKFNKLNYFKSIIKSILDSKELVGEYADLFRQVKNVEKINS